MSKQHTEINTLEDCYNFHNFPEIIEAINQDPSRMGLPPTFLTHLNASQRQDIISGEYLYRLSQILGTEASRLLKRGQWGYTVPDWFDHRHHTMNPLEESKNSWIESVAMVLRVLPKGGKILNYCAGEAYFDAEYFSNMASQIDCFDINESDEYKNHLIQQNLQRSPNINYHYRDILSHDPTENTYDVVIMRSAIEHFSEKNQTALMTKIKKALTETGWFVGDTPANPNKNHQKEHDAHENEWADENEARDFLTAHFKEVQTYTIHCNLDPRDTIFFQCR